MGSIRDSKKTQQNIINTAMKLFARDGFDGVSVDIIAKDANINKAMIYYYFKNKAQLYKRVVSTILDEIYHQILKDIKRADKPKDELRIFIETFCNFAWNNPYLSSLMLAELGNGAKNLPDDMFVGLKQIFLLLSDILKRGEEKGCFFDVEPIIIHFMITGTINLFISTKKLRKKVAKEISVDVCNGCSQKELSSYIYKKIIKMLREDIC